MEITRSQQLTLQIIHDLHKDWTPHSGQLEVGKPLIDGKVDTVFLQCGRKWGKSDFAIYMLWRWALMNPGSACYYITPTLQQGKEIVWANNRLQTFGDKKYLQGDPNNSELRIRFKNGSYIKILGSENYGAANGLTADFVVYDEFKEFHHKFHDVMNPNRAVHKAPLLIIGTPPAIDDTNRLQYIDYAEECVASDNCLHIRHSSYKNPHIDRDWLDKEKARLFNRGEPEVWYREYEGKIVAGGKRAIFPMLDREQHVYKHGSIYRQIRRDLRRMEWVVSVDPGTSTCMAALFVAVHPYSKEVYVLDEIYETNKADTSTRKFFPRLLEKTAQLFPRGDIDEDWTKVYDEAGAWFSNEVMANYGTFFGPTEKYVNKKDDGISLIKDLLLENHVYISDRCTNLLWEMENYSTDDQGRYMKKYDHLIDCFRYMLHAINYDMVEVRKYSIRKDPISDRRDRKLDKYLESQEKRSDWTRVADFLEEE